MTDPRMSSDFSDITFRDRMRAAPKSRDVTGLFWIGVAIFIGVAAAYPFYSYAVQTRLLARDVGKAVAEVERQTGALVEDFNRETAAATQRSAEAQKANRLRRVSLAGSTVVNGQRVVIVDLGQASFDEAKPTICRLAARRFGASFADERLCVQLHRGRAPAVEAGVIRCD